ncbi:MAG: hypothetical protein WC280_00190 [Patescibacteria group bacterium]
MENSIIVFVIIVFILFAILIVRSKRMKRELKLLRKRVDLIRALTEKGVSGEDFLKRITIDTPLNLINSLYCPIFIFYQNKINQWDALQMWMFIFSVNKISERNTDDCSAIRDSLINILKEAVFSCPSRMATIISTSIVEDTSASVYRGVDHIRRSECRNFILETYNGLENPVGSNFEMFVKDLNLNINSLLEGAIFTPEQKKMIEAEFIAIKIFLKI